MAAITYFCLIEQIPLEIIRSIQVLLYDLGSFLLKDTLLLKTLDRYNDDIIHIGH